MKRLLVLAFVAMLAGAAYAQSSILNLVSSTGEEAAFEITDNDPDKAPVLYAGGVLFNNTGFTARASTCAGAGAELRYTYRNKLQLDGYWMQGVSCTSSYQSGIYRNGEVGATWHFSSAITEMDRVTRLKSSSNSILQVFTVPAKASREMGMHVAYNSSGIPLNTYKADYLSSMHGQISYVSTSSFAAGVAFNESSSFRISSNEYGSKLHCVTNTFYADALWAISTRAELMNVPVIGEDSPVFKYIKYGGRIGYERIAMLKQCGLGSIYRLEAGYRPGLAEYDAGVYVKFHAGICFGYKAKRKG